DKNKIIVIAWLVPPLLLFSFVFKVHQLRFILPIIPVIVIATVIGMRSKARLPGIIFKSLFSIFLLVQIYLLLFSKELSPVHEKILASSSREYLMKTEQNSNLEIAGNFYNLMQKFLNSGDYKIIIVRFAPVEDGPVGLQFWLEFEGYKYGYNVFTHDLFDQWPSVDRWLEEKGSYIVLFLLDIDRDLVLEHDLSTLSLTRIDEVWFPWHEELMQAKATLEKILLRIDDPGHLFDFAWSSYYCKVYRYENF
ncbi:MAG: hypothetical protein PHQ54_02785, partial [Candidatus Omnitrophica bacterium]|nr:hypothetical protein [Candidatus Omnitrophota bacterium]